MSSILEIFSTLSVSQRLSLLIGGVAVLLILFASFKVPRHTKNWVEDLALLPGVHGPEMAPTITNVRDWRWDEKTAVSHAYQTVTVNPENIEDVWFILEPFEGSTLVGHTFVLFQMVDGSLLGLTVEARKEKGETYSALRGVLNQYELIYLWGTAEDLLTQRARKLRHPQYVWKLKLTPDQKRAFFHRLVDKTRALETAPRFYNTLWNNCTNELAQSAGLDWGWAHILTGQSIRYLEQRGFLPAGSVDHHEDISPLIRSIPSGPKGAFDKTLISTLTNKQSAIG